MSLASRIARIESRSNATFTTIIVTGGLPGEIEHATAGGRHWERERDEPFESFVERVKQAARALGETLLVFGGLP